MDSVIVRIIVLALGVALSPVPVVGVLVILLGRRARVGGLLFAGAWVLGNATAITIAIAFAGTLSVPRQGYDLPFEGLMTAVLGVGLVLSAWLARRGRFRSEDPFATPKWVNSVDNLSPTGGAVVAFTNATTSPKNLGLAILAGATIQGAASPWEASSVAEALLYVAVASITIVTPVVAYLVFGERAEAVLARVRTFVTSRASALMEIMFFVVGLGLAAKGVYNLLS